MRGTLLCKIVQWCAGRMGDGCSQLDGLGLENEAHPFYS